MVSGTDELQESQANGSWVCLVSISCRVPRKGWFNRVPLAEKLSQSVGRSVLLEAGRSNGLDKAAA